MAQISLGPAADPEGDRVTNAMEYALLTDPAATDRLAGSLTLESSGDTLVARFRRDRSRPDVILSLEQSGNLHDWTGLAATLVDDQLGIETWEATLPAGPSRRFIRLRGTIAQP